jgi:glycosyltransferase involved in cell wall biosynthesis
MATSVEFGGIERVLLTQLQHMDREIELVPIVFTRTDRPDNSFFHRLRALGVRHETLFVNTVRPYALLNPVVNLGQALRLVRRSRFDLIHSHGYRADAFALAVARWHRLPLVSTCHGFVGIDRRLRFYNALDARLLRSFTRVIAVSHRMKEDLVAHGLSDDRVEVIANAVAEAPVGERAADRQSARSRLGIADGEFVFGYVGRLSEEKGVHYLLDAAAQTRTCSTPCRFVIVGDGPQRGALEALARKHALDGTVVFTGFQGDTAPWYAAMDAFVLPSVTEGTPMALLEAMACGVPSIASAVGGVPAVIADGHNGLLVRPADVEHLSTQMRALASATPLRLSLAAGAIETVRARYGVAAWVQNMAAVYRRSLQDMAVAQ